MATASSLSFNLSAFGSTVTIPDDDVARLMYYLSCVTISLGLDILQDDLVDFQNYHHLSSVRIALVFKSALEFSPDVFLGKLLFLDDAGEVIPPGDTNEFINITAACDIVSIQRDFIIGGQVKDVTKVMFFKSSWLDKFYNGPLERVAKALLAASSKHCEHCEGGPGMCACSACPRVSKSECKPSFRSLLNALNNGSAAPSTPRFTQPAPPPPYTAPTPATSTSTTSTVSSMPPGPLDTKNPAPSPSYNPNTLFYLSMSIAELKSFLTEREVDPGDILDKETLCKSVWETHCDSISISELNTFLSQNKISTAGCRDVGSRRQKAKDAYQPPPRPVPSPPSAGSGGWKKDDVVVLLALKKEEMNGKKGVIQVVDTAQGKVTVFVEDMGKAFKVKYENVKPYVEEDDEAEELF